VSNATITHYSVFNRITGKTTSYKTGVAASRAAERMNMAYGAHIAGRRAHWSDEAVAA
jgi:hypothetical protein